MLLDHRKGILNFEVMMSTNTRQICLLVLGSYTLHIQNLLYRFHLAEIVAFKKTRDLLRL